MIKYTGKKLLYLLITAIVIFTLIQANVISNIINGISNALDTEEYAIYSDMPSDIISNSYNIAIRDGVSNSYFCPTNSFSEDIKTNGPILVNDIKSYENLYSYIDIMGYYSMAYIGKEDFVLEISNSYENKANNYTYVIDFIKILNSFMENKSWKDIGYNIDGPIKLEVFYENVDDIYYRMYESQILYALTGIKNQKSEDFEKYREEIDKVINKIPKATKLSLEDGTLYILCEQSSTFKTLMNLREESYIPCYSRSIACEPIYFACNDNEKYISLAESLKIDDFYNISKGFGFRMADDTSHSRATSFGDSTKENPYALDSVDKVLRVD